MRRRNRGPHFGVWDYERNRYVTPFVTRNKARALCETMNVLQPRPDPTWMVSPNGDRWTFNKPERYCVRRRKKLRSQR